MRTVKGTLLFLFAFVLFTVISGGISEKRISQFDNHLFAFTHAESDTFVEYFPLHVGDWWEYMRISPDTTFFTPRIVGTDTIDSIIYYEFSSGQKYRNDSLGHIIFFDDDSETEKIFYDYTVAIGDSWTFDDGYWLWTLQWLSFDATVVLDVGTFRNTALLYSYTPEKTVEFFEWFAPDIGKVFTEAYDNVFSPFTWLNRAVVGDTVIGDTSTIGVNNEPDFISPKTPKIIGNLPNPFNSETTIEYELPFRSTIDISVYDMMGRKVRQLVRGSREAGLHKTTWDGKNESGVNVASSIYVVSLFATPSMARIKNIPMLSSHKIALIR